MSPLKKKNWGEEEKKRIVGRKERPEKRKDVHKRELDSSLTENLGYTKEKQNRHATTNWARREATVCSEKSQSLET